MAGCWTKNSKSLIVPTYGSGSSMAILKNAKGVLSNGGRNSYASQGTDTSGYLDTYPGILCLLFGTGTTAPKDTDVCLESPVTFRSGSSGTLDYLYKLSYTSYNSSSNSGFDSSKEFIRKITQRIAPEITRNISEIGLYLTKNTEKTRMGTFMYLFAAGDPTIMNQSYLLYREVLENPITLEANKEYNFEFLYPNIFKESQS